MKLCHDQTCEVEQLVGCETSCSRDPFWEQLRSHVSVLRQTPDSHVRKSRPPNKCYISGHALQTGNRPCAIAAYSISIKRHPLSKRKTNHSDVSQRADSDKLSMLRSA